MGTEAFPANVRAVLSEAVDPGEVEIKPDGICYMPGYYWRRQLNKAFGPGGWGFAPRTPARVMGNIVTWDGVLIAMGRVVATAVGECAYRANNPNMSYASCVEGAKTDAIGRCCKDLGMALELHDPKWRRWWQPEYAEKYQDREGRDRWRLKKRDSRATPIDIAAGAGGKAPEVAQSGTPDTGEAAAPDDYEAVRTRLKALEWKGPWVKVWLKDLFGVEKITAMTAQQVGDALALLMAVTPGAKPIDCPAYVGVAAKLREAGRIQ
jgi:hypothetical protein